MDEAVGALPQDELNRAGWQAKLRKAGLTSCKLPEKNVVFGGTSERATIQLLEEGVTANMQSDIGAVEAWATTWCARVAQMTGIKAGGARSGIVGKGGGP